MLCNRKMIATLARLNTEDLVRLRNASREANRLERIWKEKFLDYLSELDEKVFQMLLDGKDIKEIDVDVMPLVVDFSFQVMAAGFKSGEKDAVEIKLKMLARPPNEHIPKSYGDLRALYDKWRKKQKITPRQKSIADRIHKAYIKRCQSIWKQYGRAFREGATFDGKKVRDFLRDNGEMDEGRADMIVRTETTYFYNKARRTVYDQSNDVTHYLFVSIRDHATTRWCKTRQGLVYKKGSAILDSETPPVHWNCRSELLPLTPQNPKHLALIEDKGLARKNNICAPLPTGWGKR